MLLQDNAAKLFDIEGQIVRVSEGGWSAYIKTKNKGGRIQTFLRNSRFRSYDSRFRTDEEVAMATSEGEVSNTGCQPLRQFYRTAGLAFRRAKGSVPSILRRTLAMLPGAPELAAGSPK